MTVYEAIFEKEAAEKEERSRVLPLAAGAALGAGGLYGAQKALGTKPGKAAVKKVKATFKSMAGRFGKGKKASLAGSMVYGEAA